MLTEQAIELLLDTGSLRTFREFEIPGGKIAYLIPDGTRIEDGEKFQAAPNRITETRTFLDPKSFGEYAAPFQTDETIIVGSLKDRTATAYLDYHGAGAPSWNCHKAVLKLTHTEEWAAWVANDGKTQTQLDFAEFLELQNHCIIEPDSARMIEIALNLKNTVDVTFESKINVHNGGSTFTYNEDVRAANQNLTVPNVMGLSIPVFVGDKKPASVAARLQYRIPGGKPTFKYKLTGPERIVEAALRSAWEEIEKITGKTVLIAP